MSHLNKEKTDVVSVILDDTELLDTFVDTLKIETADDFSLSTLSANSFGRAQMFKCYLWKKIKDVMSFLSKKIQILAVLAEYNFKSEEKKIQLALIKKD